MQRLVLILPLLLLGVGCDSVRPDPAESGNPSPLPGSDLQTYEIFYEVTGTYARCDITYATDAGQVQMEEDMSLPWTKQLHVRVERPMEAFLSATCRHPERMGKSKVIVAVDDSLKAQGGTTGYGATAEAHYTIGK